MTTGLENVLGNLHRLQTSNRTAAKKAVDEGAKIFAKQLKENTPKDEGELAEDVVVSGFKGANQGLIEKDIGYGKGTGRRAKYPDTGTINQKAQNFIERTKTESTPEIKETYARYLKEGMNL